jgi:type IV pilus assembly protein PilV
MSAPRPAARAGGFTMIEVLIAVIVISIGLLGIAKMQALAFSSTGVASMRSIAALEASSLAASMHADRSYWASGVAAPPPAGVTVTGTTISDPNLSAAANCLSTGTPPDCGTQVMAAYDLQQWATAVQNVLPNPVSTIICSNTVNVPVSCTIQVTWSENLVAINAQGTSQATMLPSNYVLYVEP